MKMIHSLFTAIVGLATFAYAQDNIVDVVSQDEGLTLLFGLLQESGADALLNGTGPYTLFAPTDDAFTALLGSIPENLLTPQVVSTVLQYHVLDKSVTSDQLTAGSQTTVSGEVLTVEINADGGVEIIDGTGTPAMVTEADKEAQNGVIHTIDKVLIPPTVAEALGIASTGTPAQGAGGAGASEAPVETMEPDMGGAGGDTEMDMPTMAPTNDSGGSGGGDGDSDSTPIPASVRPTDAPRSSAFMANNAPFVASVILLFAGLFM